MLDKLCNKLQYNCAKFAFPFTMSSLKHNLTEVLCSFSFDSNIDQWDSTYFGKFYDKIKSRGYTEKQEQKGVQFKFEIKAKEPLISQASTDQTETRMIFRNLKDNTAIILAPYYISFHKLEPYESWEKFRDTEVVNGMNDYISIGLGSSLKQAQMLYLNRYEFDSGTGLSEKFRFLPAVEKFGIGKEKSLRFQSQYEFEPNLLMQIKLNANLLPNSLKEVILECTCLAKTTKNSDTFLSLVELAHSKNNEVFKAITQ